MKKRWLKTAAALCAAAVFAAMAGGCRGKWMAETQITDIGFGGHCSCEPPEQKVINVDGETVRLSYDGSQTDKAGNTGKNLTDNLPAVSTDIYTSENGYFLRMDGIERITSLMTDLSRDSGWIAADTTETRLMEVLEKVATQIDVDLSKYPDAELYGTGQLRLYKDADSPYTDYIHAEFDETGKFCFVHICYSNIVSLSAADEKYFAELLEDSIDSDTPYTVSTSYCAREGVLIASYTVTFTKDSGETWVENYIAGLPVEH